MNVLELEQRLNSKLSPHLIQDFAPNGLQIEGRSDVKRIITGVTASQALIDEAIKRKADALLVHHGYFWKGEPAAIRGMKGRRIRSLIQHDINLLGYHLPLDIHPELGNNVLLAQHLGIQLDGGLDNSPQSIALYGHFEQPITARELCQRLEQNLQRPPLHISSELCSDEQRLIKTIGWCSGGGQSYIEQAAEKGLDAFISGEISEKTTHIAREMGIDYFCAGHHATERYGIKALGEWLAAEYGLDVEFVDIDNPV